MGESKSATVINTLPSQGEFVYNADKALTRLWGVFFRGWDYPVVLDEVIDKLQQRLVVPGINISHSAIPAVSLTREAQRNGATSKGVVEIGFHTPVSDTIEGQPILLTLGNGFATVEHFFDHTERHLMLTGRINTYGMADVEIASPYAELLHHGLPNDTFSINTPNYKLSMAVAGVNTFMQVASQ